MRRHLEDEEIGQCAEHLIGLDDVEASVDLLQHVENCDRCKKEVMEAANRLLDMLEDAD